jgi:hypothetical protein
MATGDSGEIVWRGTSAIAQDDEYRRLCIAAARAITSSAFFNRLTCATRVVINRDGSGNLKAEGD